MNSSYKYSIGLYVYYFGEWPEWIDLYWEALRRNPSVDFHVFTDCIIPEQVPENVYFHKIAFNSYIEFINKRIKIKVKANNGVKLCDLRPLLGIIHKELFKQYDFYGWLDVDLFVGNIRCFYTDTILSKYSVLSSHRDRIAGHFSIFKNTSRNRNKYRKIYKWREALLNDAFVGIDEHGLTNAYKMTIFDKIGEKYSLYFENYLTRYLSGLKKKKLYLVEQYSTPFTPIPWLDGSINSNQPSEWYYRDGVITNKRDGDRRFMYLHFMNFKSSQWRHDGTKAPWEGLTKVCFANTEDMINGIVINANGIRKIENNGGK